MRNLGGLILGAAVSCVALFLTFRRADLSAILSAANQGDYRLLPPFLLLLLAIHLLRTARWGLFLPRVPKVPFRRLNAAAAVGFMAVLVFPFRLGEVARPALIADKDLLPLPVALSSVVAERVVDGLSIALVLLLALLSLPASEHLVLARAAGWTVALLFAGILAVVLFAHGQREAFDRALLHLASRAFPKAKDRVLLAIRHFVDGTSALRPGRRLGLVLLATLSYWGLAALSIALLARAFGIFLAPVAALVVLGVNVLGVMVPSAPGMVGTSQAATLLGLALVAPGDVDRVRRIAFANVLWAAQVSFQVALGLAFLPSSWERLRALRRTSR